MFHRTYDFDNLFNAQSWIEPFQAPQEPIRCHHQSSLESGCPQKYQVATTTNRRKGNSDHQRWKREPHRVQKGVKISLNSIHGSHRQQIVVQVSHHGVQWSQNHAHRSQKDANMVPTWGQHDAKTQELGAQTVSKLITSQPNTSWPKTSQPNTSLSKKGPAAGA